MGTEELEPIEEMMGGDVAGSPPKGVRWLMDGTEHQRGSDCWCARARSVCETCGGLVHHQSHYGGIYYMCEACGRAEVPPL